MEPVTIRLTLKEFADIIQSHVSHKYQYDIDIIEVTSYDRAMITIHYNGTKAPLVVGEDFCHRAN